MASGRGKKCGGGENNRGWNEEHESEGGKGTFQIVEVARCDPFGDPKGGGAFRVQVLLPSTVQLKK